MKPHLFSIGHSNHPQDHFLGLLQQHEMQTLVDIRRFPSSKKFPHLNQESLASALANAGIEYRWLEALGGRRRKIGTEASVNRGLRNDSFRNYADYMLTKPFREAVKELLESAAEKRTCMMCAEAVFWRCHRRLVSDYLLANGVVVQHLFPNGEIRRHQLTEGARIEQGMVTYPGAD